MLSDGLKYQDSRMATCEEMKQDLAPFALHDAAAKSKGGPVLLRDGDTVYTDPSDSFNEDAAIRASSHLFLCGGG